MGWKVIAKNDQETVKEKKNPDGTTEYLHFYSDDSLTQEAANSRNGQNHDHITFNPDGSIRYDSTQL
jgi:hypothetical protein